MTMVEQNSLSVCVIFEGGPVITVPAVWQIKFLNQRFAGVTFRAKGLASIVVLKEERVYLAALRIGPGKPYYYTLTITSAPPND